MDANIASIIVAAIGTGGLGSAITAFLSRKKYQVEALRLEEDLRASREEANRKSIDYIQTKMIEISKKYEEESIPVIDCLPRFSTSTSLNRKTILKDLIEYIINRVSIILIKH